MTRYNVSQLKSLCKLEPVTGVYRLYSNDDVVYVGSSISVMGRVSTHLKECNIEFSDFDYIACGASDRLEIEAQEIVNLNPSCNKRMPANSFMVNRKSVIKGISLDIADLMGAIDADWSGDYDYLRKENADSLVELIGVAVGGAISKYKKGA